MRRALMLNASTFNRIHVSRRLLRGHWVEAAGRPPGLPSFILSFPALMAPPPPCTLYIHRVIYRRGERERERGRKEGIRFDLACETRKRMYWKYIKMKERETRRAGPLGYISPLLLFFFFFILMCFIYRYMYTYI